MVLVKKKIVVGAVLVGTGSGSGSSSVLSDLGRWARAVRSWPVCARKKTLGARGLRPAGSSSGSGCSSSSFLLSSLLMLLLILIAVCGCKLKKMRKMMEFCSLYWFFFNFYEAEENDEDSF
ncbi:hypothetical protein RJT34_16408 [Clitoria ternatea]|uniref:Uncharacterized protein n=1 Tax=Clitoria ternatea TaxID=43366 RepID=A0AAN9PC85_CLITE